MKSKAFALALMAATAAPVVAGATIYHFQTSLSGLNESPPTTSAGFGLGDMVWDDAAHTATLAVTFQDLTGTTAASHTHSPTPGQAGPNFTVATTTPTYAGFPLGVTSGAYNTVLDLTLATSYNPVFVAAFGSVSAAEAGLLNGLLAGQAYLNIHTTVLPAGEIRGTWTLVPEPGAWMLMIAGFGGVGAMLRRRRLAFA